MEKRRRGSRSFGISPAKPPGERDISMFCSFQTYLFVFPLFCPPPLRRLLLLWVPSRRLGPSFLALVATTGNFSGNLLIDVLERRIVTFEIFIPAFSVPFAFLRPSSPELRNCPLEHRVYRRTELTSGSRQLDFDRGS